ncbi:MAG: hypothetical protein CSA31_01900 [Desulfobulbus propionicus]|nr:MAG: hypothetical protein CSB34_00270 [Desulfobulbus propionicus]PIE60470.1 MAG: hypothetical protein CSA31_01900 [Desulfobulbus propionicus]
MRKTPTQKSIMLAAILTTGLSLAISQAAIAQPGVYHKRGTGPCQVQQLDPAMKEAKQKFMAATVQARKQMAEKRAAMRAVMHADQPDPAQASKIAGELFDLREQLRVKAQELGLPMAMIGAHGNLDDCDGMQQRKGHQGRHGHGKGQGNS